MAEAAFIVVGMLYLIVAMKTLEWHNLVLLGMETAAPQHFLQKSYVYQLISIVLFWLTFSTCLFFSLVPWWSGSVILAALYLVSHTRGQIRAFRVYRLEMADTLEYVEDPKEREYFYSESQRTHSQLVQLVRERSALAHRMRAA